MNLTVLGSGNMARGVATRALAGGNSVQVLSGDVDQRQALAEELRSFAEVPVPKTEIKKGELEMAIKVIDQSASDEFKPENYKDNVRRRILDQIQQKVEGKEITEEPTEAPKTQIIDLMEALKASIAKGGRTAGDKKPAQRAGSKGKAPKVAKPALKQRKAG